MNLFATFPDPAASVIGLADRHVVKMVLETAQILSTILGGPYKPTHANHPSVRWAAADPRNLSWTLDHGLALLNEYHLRYGKVHACAAVYDALTPRIAVTPEPPASFVYVGPEEYASGDVHASYRAYLAAKYATWGDKARWTKRERPGWAMGGAP